MQVIVNVGLATASGGVITVPNAIAALQAFGHTVTAQAVHASDTEQTLVAYLDQPLSATEAYIVAHWLDQDCVAQVIVWGFDGGYEGELYGPNAEKWGEFNPAFFLTIDGGRLA